MKSNWKLKKIDEEVVRKFSCLFDLDESVSSILYLKGITEFVDAYSFLYPRLSSLYSPFLMKGMLEAVERIRSAIRKKEKIGIFSDSDLDGLTSLTILLGLFNRLGIESSYRYPTNEEAYGLTNDVIDEFSANDVSLLITLDSGIRDIKEVEYAKDLDMDVIVCDHHNVGKVLPDAIIVNPKQEGCRYPFKELAGVGVTYKLWRGILLSYLQNFNKYFIIIVKDDDGTYLSYIRNGIIEKKKYCKNIINLKELFQEINESDNIIIYDFDDEEHIQDIFNKGNIYDLNRMINFLTNRDESHEKLSFDEICEIFSIKKYTFNKKCDIINYIFLEIEYNESPKINEFERSIIGLVSIGTIADIMPLKGENRIITHYGIESINATTHPGFSMLIKKDSCKINSKRIAWHIAPLLNTPGRFGKSDLTAQFFFEKNPQCLKSILDEISILNDDRKRIVFELYNEILDDLKKGVIKEGKNLLFIKSESIPEGLCGLLANRLTDFVCKPVIIVSLMGNKELLKGSGRTGQNINFFSFVEPFSSLFENLGGHEKAFGFIVKSENIDEIEKQIELCIGDNFEGSNTEIPIDLVLSIGAVDYKFVENLSIFEPYGYENEESIFLSRDVRLMSFSKFGKAENHGRYRFLQNDIVEAIGWNLSDEMEKFFKESRGSGSDEKKIDIIYKLENNDFRGKISPRCVILDIDWSESNNLVSNVSSVKTSSFYA